MYTPGIIFFKLKLRCIIFNNSNSKISLNYFQCYPAGYKYLSRNRQIAIARNLCFSGVYLSFLWITLIFVTCQYETVIFRIRKSVRKLALRETVRLRINESICPSNHKISWRTLPFLSTIED